LKDRIKIIEMGDLYDLWVGRRLCLFKENANGTMQLIDGSLTNANEISSSMENELRNSNKILEELGYPNLSAVGNDSSTVNAAKLLSNWINEIKGIYPANENKIEKPLNSADQNHYFDNWVSHVVKTRCGENKQQLQEYYELLRSETLHDAIGTYYYLINPAVKAIELLEKEFDVVYIYGNHDNYLGINEVCIVAGLKNRVRYYSNASKPKSIFIEHGHRMEAFFAFGVVNNMFGLNNDGCKTGYDATLGQYIQQLAEEDKNILIKFLELLPPYIVGKKLVSDDSNTTWWETIPVVGLVKRLKVEFGLTIADWWGQWHDQKEYYGESAQVWLGRYFAGDSQKAAPHIFVIGHTHRAMLREIDIIFTASETPVDRRRPRRVS
jgi:UDP-2,3-diacylglucosamine pyrophosphatase LpxH